ncbi:MAG: DNA polymerase III subunit delta', partial [Chloroflexi bacterium]|nr:DNA polymerase III subunit delta' [Chloroflexota bacterium]
EGLLAELGAWQGWWRDVLLVRSGSEDGVANIDRLVELREDATRLRRDGLAAFVRAVGEAGRQLQENAQPRLVMETLLLGAPAESG